MPDLHYLYTYEVLAEQTQLEAKQTHQFRFEIFKISLGWTLFSLLILFCGWGMNLRGVFDVGLIATVVCVLLSAGAFFVNATTYRHLNKKAKELNEKMYAEKKMLDEYLRTHKDVKLKEQLAEWEKARKKLSR